MSPGTLNEIRIEVESVMIPIVPLQLPSSVLDVQVGTSPLRLLKLTDVLDLNVFSARVVSHLSPFTVSMALDMKNLPSAVDRVL